MRATSISDTLLPGAGPLGSLFGKVDWAASAVGDPSAWPAALRIALSFMLDSPDSVYLVWGSERTFFFNEAYIPILGPRLDRAMGSRFEELWADAWPSVAPAFIKAEAGQSTKFKDMAVPMARYGEAEETWWTFSYTPIRDETGAVAGVICVTNETTKHVLEARARAARERYNRQIIDSATDFAIVATGPDARITLWNKGAEGVLGWTEDEMLGDVVDRIFTPEDRAEGRPQVEMERALASGHGNDERWHLRKDGERFWAQGEMTPLMHDDHAHGFVKVLRDRTPERVRQQRLDLLARASAGLLSSDDPDEVLQDILASGGDALGYDQSYSYLLNDDCSRMRPLHSEGASQDVKKRLQDVRVADVPLCGLVAQSREPLVIDHIQQATDPGTQRSRENGVRAYAGYPVLAGDKLYGVISFVSTTRDAFDDEALAFFDSFARFLSIGRERLDRELTLSDLAMTLEQRVKERTQALMASEEALRQSQKMDAVGQLTGGVAHDFNNILTVIRGSVDLLRRDNLPGDKRRRYLDAIADTSERATKLTNQLLAFARRQALSPETFNVGDRIARIVEMLDRITGARIVVEQSMPDTACYIHADVSQFETAIINLAVNARDAMNGEGRLSITLRCQTSVPEIRGHAGVNAPFAAIEITDTGIGIASNDIARIFEPFFTTKTVGKGTGLGLRLRGQRAATA